MADDRHLSTVIIPAYNEAKSIGRVVEAAAQYADEVIVVDDGSTDNTTDTAREAGAMVICQEHRGYIPAIKRGFREAAGYVVITMDGDGEHHARDIPRLMAPVMAGDADLVLGRRQKLPRVSEKLINWLTSIKVKVSDSCTGFRAIRKELASGLNLKGQCTCGILVLEADYLGARVAEVPIEIIPIDKPRRIAWRHLMQIFYVLGWLLRGKQIRRIRNESFYSGG